MHLILSNGRNGHNHHLVLLQGVYNAIILFRNVCVRKFGGTHNAIYFWDLFLYTNVFGEIYFARTKHSSRVLASSTLHCGCFVYLLMIHIMKAFFM